MNSLIERLAIVYEEHPELEGLHGQTGLVKLSGASKSVVGQWLRGSIKTMGLKYAQKLGGELGYGHAWLMDGTGPKYGEKSVRLDEYTQAVVDLMQSTDLEGRILIKNAAMRELVSYQQREGAISDHLNGATTSRAEAMRLMELYDMANPEWRRDIVQMAETAAEKSLHPPSSDQADSKDGLRGRRPL